MAAGVTEHLLTLRDMLFATDQMIEAAQVADKRIQDVLRDDDDGEIEERIAKLLGSLGTGTGPIAVHAVLLLIQHQQRKISRSVAASSERLVASSERLETLTVRLVRLTWGLVGLTVVLAVLTCVLVSMEMCGRAR